MHTGSVLLEQSFLHGVEMGGHISTLCYDARPLALIQPLAKLLHELVGMPSPLSHAQRPELRSMGAPSFRMTLRAPVIHDANLSARWPRYVGRRLA